MKRAINKKEGEMKDDTIRSFGKEISKISRYGWKTQNKPGTFMDIHKKDLIIPSEYQRSQRIKKVLDIASNWDWMACGTLLVVMRENIDDYYYVIDGGHRKAAADKRSDISTLPCLVFVGECIGKEAETFLDINNNRSAMSVFEKFKARRIAGDQSVDNCIKLLETTGHFFTNSGSSKGVTCIQAILNSYEKNETATRLLWPLCVEIHGYEIINGEIWTGLYYLYSHGISVFDYRTKLIQAGKTGCLQQINKAKLIHNAGGEKIHAYGLLEIINYKLKNRIKLSD